MQLRISCPSGPAGQILVIRCSPLWMTLPSSTHNHPTPPQAAERVRRSAGRGEHPRRGGERGRRWSRSRATTHPPRRHSRAGVRPTAPPRCRRPTNADAGCRRSSMTRTRPGDPSTANLSGSATTPRRPPFGDPSTDAHAAAPDPATTAPTQPTEHRSGHGALAHEPAYRNRPRTFTGHALVPTDDAHTSSLRRSCEGGRHNRHPRTRGRLEGGGDRRRNCPGAAPCLAWPPRPGRSVPGCAGRAGERHRGLVGADPGRFGPADTTVDRAAAGGR